MDKGYKAASIRLERTDKGYFSLCKAFQSVTEGVRFHDVFGMPAKKRLKPDAIPTIFPKPGESSQQDLEGQLLKGESEKQ